MQSSAIPKIKGSNRSKRVSPHHLSHQKWTQSPTPTHSRILRQNPSLPNQIHFQTPQPWDCPTLTEHHLPLPTPNFATITFLHKCSLSSTKRHNYLPNKAKLNITNRQYMPYHLGINKFMGWQGVASVEVRDGLGWNLSCTCLWKLFLFLMCLRTYYEKIPL
ncbi:unnamed protein product [Camellia sinensis]